MHTEEMLCVSTRKFSAIFEVCEFSQNKPIQIDNDLMSAENRGLCFDAYMETGCLFEYLYQDPVGLIYFLVSDSL